MLNQASYRLISDALWKHEKQSERYDDLALMVHESLFKPETKPVWDKIRESGMGFFVCMREGKSGSTSPLCGEWIPANTRNTGIDRHPCRLPQKQAPQGPQRGREQAHGL
jgi:hypothetical protein